LRGFDGKQHLVPSRARSHQQLTATSAARSNWCIGEVAKSAEQVFRQLVSDHQESPAFRRQAFDDQFSEWKNGTNDIRHELSADFEDVG